MYKRRPASGFPSFTSSVFIRSTAESVKIICSEVPVIKDDIILPWETREYILSCLGRGWLGERDAFFPDSVLCDEKEIYAIAAGNVPLDRRPDRADCKILCLIFAHVFHVAVFN